MMSFLHGTSDPPSGLVTQYYYYYTIGWPECTAQCESCPARRFNIDFFFKSFRVTRSMSIKNNVQILTSRLILYLDVEACSAPTTACRVGVIDDLELRPDQLHCEVDLTPLQQLKRGEIEDDLGRRQIRLRRRTVVGRIRENGVVLADGRLFSFLTGGGFLLGGRQRRRQRHQLHQVLEAVAAAALNLDAQCEVWIVVLGHDLGEALCVQREFVGQSLSILVTGSWEGRERASHTFAARGVISSVISLPSSSNCRLWIACVARCAVVVLKARCALLHAVAGRGRCWWLVAGDSSRLLLRLLLLLVMLLVVVVAPRHRPVLLLSPVRLITGLVAVDRARWCARRDGARPARGGAEGSSRSRIGNPPAAAGRRMLSWMKRLAVAGGLAQRGRAMVRYLLVGSCRLGNWLLLFCSRVRNGTGGLHMGEEAGRRFGL